MDRDEFMELVYETFADEPDNVLANGIIEAADAYVEHEKAQLLMQGTTKDATSDLISRQAALNALTDAVKSVGVLDADDIKVVFDNLPSAQPEPQWIPVSERLPEKSANYLVTVRWYREDDIEISVYEYNAWHKEWNDGESCGQRVIAWMPLPEAYKPNK